MRAFDPLSVVGPLLFFLAISALCYNAARARERNSHKSFLLLFHFLLFVNSGVAVAYSDVPGWYFWLYAAFALFFSFGFFVSTNIGSRSLLTFPNRSLSIIRKIGKRPLIAITLLLALAPLLYPNFRLAEIFSPPQPDIRTWFGNRFDGAPDDVIIKIVKYIEILTFPLFLWALYFYKRHVVLVLTLFTCLLYFQYVADQYIARGTVLIMTLSLAVFYYEAFPRMRARILFLCLMLAPSAAVLLQVYTAIRLGSYQDINTNIFYSIFYLFESQTTFPSLAGVAVIESGERTGLVRYASWLLTLPIPSFLLGDIDRSLLNYEMSSIALGIDQRHSDWFVLLPGVVAESVYVLGPFFFVYALFFGLLSGGLLSLLSSKEELGLLRAYFIVFLAYKIPGGGAASVLPVVVNGLLLFFMFYFLGKFRWGAN